MKIIKVIIVISVVVFQHPLSIYSQSSSNDPLTQEQRRAIIDKIDEIFTEYYPLPEVSSEMIEIVKKRERKGKYNSLDLIEFTTQLTKDLRESSKDHHIRVTPYEKIPDDLSKEIKLGSPDDNYGFRSVKILPGNMGYIELTSFNNPASAGPTAIAAMNFVAHSDAIIIDLRLNGGGDAGMAQFISSYFFERVTHLTDYYIRKDNVTEQVWTQEWVSGPKILEAPIYILMSNFSYSSSEVLAYQLQQLGRAEIVGEKTKGGAHGVRYMSFPMQGINLKVPYSQEINPHSKTNYINGIIPDFPSSSENALFVAQNEAAKVLIEKEKDSVKRYKLEWLLSGIEVELNPVDLSKNILTDYMGKYQNIIIGVYCGKLTLKRGKNKEQFMIPMGDDIFKYEDIIEEKFRIKFVRDKAGSIKGLYDFDSDGDTHPLKKIEKN